MIDAAKKTELEDLEELLASAGWKALSEMVGKLWGASEGNGERFLDAVTKASRASDADALAHLRQIIAAQREIHAIMQWPQTRLAQLKAAEGASGPIPFNPSRRGTGL